MLFLRRLLLGLFLVTSPGYETLLAQTVQPVDQGKITTVAPGPVIYLLRNVTQDVLQDNQIVGLNVITGAITETLADIYFPLNESSAALALDPTGKHFFIVNQTNAKGSVPIFKEYNPETGEITVLGQAPDLALLPGETFIKAAANGQGEVFFLSSVGTLVSFNAGGFQSTFKRRASITISDGDNGLLSGGDIAFDNDGTLYAVGSGGSNRSRSYVLRIDLCTNKAEKLLALPSENSSYPGIAFGSDGSLYVCTLDQLFTVDLAKAVIRPLYNLPERITDLASCNLPTYLKRLKVTKEVNRTRSISGGELTYTLRVTNVGTLAQQNVKLIDDIPLNTVYISGSTILNGIPLQDAGTGKFPFSGSGAFVNSPDQPPGTILANAEGATLQFKVRVNCPFDPGSNKVENRASISLPLSGCAGDVEKIESTDVLTGALQTVTEVVKSCLSLDKRHEGNFGQGLPGAFSITLRNEGSETAVTGATLTDTLPAGLTFNGFSGSGWSTSTPIGSSGVVTFTLAQIPEVGRSAILTVNVLASPGALPTLTNRAGVQLTTFPEVTLRAADAVVINQIPVLSDTTIRIFTDQDYIGNLLPLIRNNAGAFLVNASPFTSPERGSLKIKANGAFQYLQTGVTGGSDSFIYQVCTSSEPLLCSTAKVSIEIKKFNIVIPKAFTPNGDGKNDRFQISGLSDAESNELEVVNRWGDEVFRKKNYGVDGIWWDGKGVNDGVYFYVLKLVHEGQALQYKGFVSIFSNR